MPTYMRVVGFVRDVACPIVSQYLKSFDHEADGGNGYGEFTRDRRDAMAFRDIEEALEFWKKIPRCRPFRVDGEPNRPLTCTSVTFETYHE